MENPKHNIILNIPEKGRYYLEIKTNLIRNSFEKVIIRSNNYK